jgi:hypothetical protein
MTPAKPGLFRRYSGVFYQIIAGRAWRAALSWTQIEQPIFLPSKS